MDEAKIIYTGWLSGSWSILVGAGLLALAFYSYLSSGTRPRPSRMAVLLFCRATAIICALFALAGPAARTTELVSERLGVGILVDNSRSMSIADTPGAVTRIDLCRKLFDDDRSMLKQLNNKFDVSYYAFGESATLTAGLSFMANKKLSGVAGAITAAVSSGESGKTGAILLASDGISNAGVSYEEAVGEISEARIPVFTLAFGQASGGVNSAEASLAALRAPRRAILNDEIVVAADIKFEGALGRKAKVKLKIDGVTVSSREVDVTSDSITQTASFNYVPVKEGLLKVAVVVEALEGELVLANNSRATYIKVTEGGIKILMVEGSFRPELTFLRRSLEEASEIVPTLRIVFPGSRDEKKLPATVKEWARYDVVMLGDLPSSALSQKSMESLAEAVENKTGLAILGGLRNFGEEGYQQTSLSDLFPVKLSSEDGFRGEHYQLKPTEIGLHGRVLRLRGTKKSVQLFWSEGAKLADYVKAGSLKQGATVLARGPRGVPVIISQRYGSGRVLAVMTDTTWRWVLSPVDYSEFHKRFWRQVILFLAGREIDDGKKVWMEMSSYGFSAGEMTSARLYIGSGLERPSGLEIRASARASDGRSSVARFLDAGSFYSADLSGLPAGDYELRADVYARGKKFGGAKTRFIVNESTKEFERISPEFERLKHVAEATGGDYRANGKLDELLEQISELKGVYKYTRETVKPIWNNAWLFLLFTLALSLEWGLRRHWGMA